VRPGARFSRSLELLQRAKSAGLLTKSGIMLGLGEEWAEIEETVRAIRGAGTDILTVGQYLRPSEHHVPLDRWVTPAEFRRWKEIGEGELGFGHVESGPLVRSSYHAKEQARTIDPDGPGRITEILEADAETGASIDPDEAAARAAFAGPPARRLVQIGGL